MQIMSRVVVQLPLIVRAHDVGGVVKEQRDPLGGPRIRPTVDQCDHPNFLVWDCQITALLQVTIRKDIDNTLLKINASWKRNENVIITWPLQAFVNFVTLTIIYVDHSAHGEVRQIYFNVNGSQGHLSIHNTCGFGLEPQEILTVSHNGQQRKEKHRRQFREHL